MTTAKAENYPLDRFQRAAAEEEAATVLTVGEHGTGKTRTLMARVAFMLRRGVSPAHLTCITTTDQNAEDLRARMAGHPGIRDHLDKIFVGTIIQLANHILRNGGARVLGLAPHYTICCESRALDIVQVAWKAITGKEVQRRELRAFRNWRRQAMSRWPEDLPLEPGPGYRAEVAAAYEEELRWQHAVEDYELPALAFLALDRDAALREEWTSGRAKHLLVDDGTGLTARQVALLDKIRRPGGSLLITDLPWSGHGSDATIRPMALLLEPYSKLARHRLLVDHAHAEELFRLSAQVRLAVSDDPFPAPETAAGPKGRIPLLVKVEGHHDDMAAECLKEISGLEQMGVSLDEMAVLDRRGRALDRMRTKLVYSGIPYRELAGNPDDPPTDTRCAVAALTLLLNPMDFHAARIAAAAHYPNKDRILAEPLSRELHRAARETGGDLVAAAAKLLRGGELDSRNRESLERLVSSQKGLLDQLDGPESNVFEVCNLALGIVNYFRPKGLPRVLEFQKTAFLEHCQLPALPGESPRDHLRRILDLWSPALHPGRCHGTQEGVTFASFEAARGMFWNIVFLWDVSEQTIPGKVGAHSSALDAELRLFCDAVARAEQVLWMYYLADTGMAGERYSLSSFLEPEHVRNLLEFRHVAFQPPPSYPDPFARRA